MLIFSAAGVIRFIRQKDCSSIEMQKLDYLSAGSEFAG
jgi:hypothetical protein